MTLKSIISGGQTGADQAGLAAAVDLGLEPGGWLPKRCWTDDGPRPDFIQVYKMKECPMEGYPTRTEWNVRDSDGTVIFGNENSPGCTLTKRLCKRLAKPLIINPTPDELRTWVDERKIAILNVAGNRERTNRGIFGRTYKILVEAFGTAADVDVRESAGRMLERHRKSLERLA